MKFKKFILLITLIFILGSALAIASPCLDSDQGINYAVKGVGKGIYVGAASGYHYIYGLEPNPTIPKSTNESYSIFYDHCANDLQLNEAFCSQGKLHSRGIKCPYRCKEGVCIEKLNMLVIVSAKYAGVEELFPALENYQAAVKDDLGWHLKIIKISDSDGVGDIRKIIAAHYQKHSIRTVLFVGDGIPLLSSNDYSYESPDISVYAELNEPIATITYQEDDLLEVESYNPRGIAPETSAQEINLLSQRPHQITNPFLNPEVAVSFIYPTSISGNPPADAQDLIRLLNRFSQDRDKPYLKRSKVLIHPDLNADWTRPLGLTTELDLQIDSSDFDLHQSFSYYFLIGHGSPSSIQTGGLKNFLVNHLKSLNTPFFMGSGCSVSSWYRIGQNEYGNFGNRKLDPPYPGTPVFFSSILPQSQHLRAAILSSLSGARDFDAFFEALENGQTLAEAWLKISEGFPQGRETVYQEGRFMLNGLTLVGDPTFHFANRGCSDSDGGKDTYLNGIIRIDGQFADQDNCILFNENQLSGVPECSGSECGVAEHYCSTLAELGFTFDQIHCPHGCQDGACLEPLNLPELGWFGITTLILGALGTLFYKKKKRK